LGFEVSVVRRPLWFSLVSAFVVPWLAHAADQCVACHTDPAKLKALIQPPTEIAQEEGEG
jgi:hypothetical protein